VQTTVIYDAYISSNSPNGNNGSSTTVYLKYIGSDMRYALFSWDKLPQDIIELKLHLKLYDNLTFVTKYVTSGGSGESVRPTDLTLKIDLYALQSPFDEDTVTWNNVPKRNLLQSDFISVQTNVYPQDIVLDLLPFSDSIPYGIMLIINDFIMEDFLSKYNTETDVYPRYVFGEALLSFRSSASVDPPVLIYNTGSRPPAPVLTSPLPWTVINKSDTESIVFEWEADDQTDRIFEYSQDGGVSWVVDEQTTEEKTFELATAGLDYGNLLARVKVKGSGGLYSDYSNQLFLQIGERPDTPVVNVTGANTANPMVSWGSDPLQHAYQVLVQQGEITVEDSGDNAGGLNTYSIKTKLENNKTYTIKVRIRDQYGIWSLYGTKDVTVSFVTPPEPIVTVYPIYPRAYSLITITNPEPGVGEEETVLNEVWRKAAGGEWIRIAYDVAGQYKDYTPAAGLSYVYKVRAVGQNGYKDSADKPLKIEIQDAQIAIAGDYEKWLPLKYNPKRSQDEGYSGELMYFSGRDKAVVEFDEFYKNAISMQFTFESMDRLAEFRELVNSRKTLLYRDSRGRKIFGIVATGINVNEDKKLYHVSFVLTETDYSEVV
jgi:hypothetical protein